MKIIIHVGMHKTGSSSIQQTFKRLQHPDVEYIDWINRGNHSDLFVLLFQHMDELVRYRAFKARGPEFTQTLPALREEWHARVSAQLAGAGDKTVILSAEDISSPRCEQAAERMRDFFAGWSDDISVIGYARPPAGFMSSIFQQRLKLGGTPDPSKGRVSPKYRARFEKIDRIFGRENVHLKEFTRDNLVQGDVVQDFAREIGVGPLAQEQIIRANESLSLEAVALLYVQRKLGAGSVQGFRTALRANTAFISRLATIGTRKFGFSPQMLAPILEKERDDIAWMEERLGHPFSESLTPHPDAIDSLDDLVDIALEQFDAVQELLGTAAIEGPATVDNLVRALERLREDCYGQSAGARPATRSLQQKEYSPMPTKTDRPKPTEEERRLQRVVSRVMWQTFEGENLPTDPEERKALWKQASKDYGKRAASLMRRLARNNLKIVETGPQD